MKCVIKSTRAFVLNISDKMEPIEQLRSCYENFNYYLMIYEWVILSALSLSIGIPREECVKYKDQFLMSLLSIVITGLLKSEICIKF